MSTRIIKINRGDSFEFPMIITKKNSTEPYFLTINDALYFAILNPHQRFEDAIILQGYTKEEQNLETGEIIIKLTPQDTRCLTPGVYYYCVKLQIGGSLNDLGVREEPDEVRTIVERTKFIIHD